MSFWLTVIRQLGRNLKQTWTSQVMTLLTVSLSVLIFAFFYLIYMNMLTVGDKLGDDLRLIVYLEEEPGPELQEQFRRKVKNFDEVESIVFTSKQEAFKRFSKKLGPNNDILDDIPQDFLPASMEIVPLKNLRSLSQVKLFADYLSSLPGTLKVQYGQEWVERFYYFTRLLSIVVLLSGGLLILTTIFMVAYTIRLTIFGRQAELELLKLVGATNNYIRTPFILEGLLQGFLGSTFGIVSLYILYQWFKDHFSTPGFLRLFEFTFFPANAVVSIIIISILLCTAGSFSSVQRFLKM